MQSIDNFLNRITMYRLAFYVLIALILQGAIFGLFGIVHYSFLQVILSALFLTAVCWMANYSLAKLFNAHANVESAYITAFILTLIVSPAQTGHDYLFLLWAGILAMASKYILAIGKKHIFNPAAIAVVITSFTLGQSASWWVGTLAMLPLVLIGGFLIVRKVQTWDMVFSFVITAFFFTVTLAFLENNNVLTFAKEIILDSPLFFLASVMLTEPLTAPPTKTLQNWYGALVGFLFVPLVHVSSFYFTPEIALCAGNIFAYIVSPKERLILTLKEKVRLSEDIYNFIFTPDAKIKFKPGQYLEWTLDHKNPDSRGNRRYFTIASSPTQSEIIVGVKFYDSPSSFKKSLLSMKPGDKLMAGQLAGDFVLPQNGQQKFVFIAGGIGITPFHSMVKYMLDSNQKRDIVVFYANRSTKDIVYKDTLDQAEKSLGIKTIYTVREATANLPHPVETGYIDEAMIKDKVPDFNQRIFYISGPRSMIENFEHTLKNLGIPSSQIKTDFFPGLV